MTVARPVLQVRDLVVRYGGVTAVDRACLDIPAAGVTALVGPSGCGKTSLLRAVAGFEAPVAGSVTLGDRVLCAPGTWVEPERREVGMVFQEGALFPHLTVGENVRFGLAGRRERERRAREILSLVGLLELEGRYPDELSGGQQQRVALARALAPSPRLILLDEPFAALDPGLREQVRSEVGQILRRSGAAALLVTHDQEEAFSLAERVAVMVDGRILQASSPEDLYREPASLQVAEFIGAGQLVGCEVLEGRAYSAFGETPCVAEDGSGRLFVRPEDLLLCPAPDVRGRRMGAVVARRFFGHDVVDRVRMDSGEEIEVRLLSSSALPVGSRVRVTLRPGPFRVFPPRSSG